MRIRNVSALFLLFAFSCASCATTKESLINRTSVGLTAARAAFTAEDERLQMAIVDGADSRVEAEKALAAHRKRRDVATKAFQTAWAALAVAALEPSDANIARLTELATLAVRAMQEVQQ